MAGSRTTNSELLAAIETARQEVSDVSDELNKKAGRGPFIALCIAVLLGAISLAGGITYYFVNEHNQCIAGNRTREEIRDIVEIAMIEDAEGLIAIAGDDAPKETIDRFRADRMERSAHVVSQLEDRDC